MAAGSEQEKNRIDAKLLSDAVIELNISKRSVGLYPRDHPITRQAIESAFSSLGDVLEHRKSISIGVTKDELIADGLPIDSKHVAIREYGHSLNQKGIAAVVFRAGLSQDELLEFNSLISDVEIPAGPMLLEVAKSRNIKNIEIIFLDSSKFRFIEDVHTGDGSATLDVLTEYVNALLEGRLADEEESNVIFNVKPGDVATVLNAYVSEKKEEPYNRLVNAYLRKKPQRILNSESLRRFLILIESLSPEIRNKFLATAVNNPIMAQKETEEVLRELSPQEIRKMSVLLEQNTSLPASLKNLLTKLAQLKQTFIDKEEQKEEGPYMDDFELIGDIVKYFREADFKKYVDEEYERGLEKLLYSKRRHVTQVEKKFRESLYDDVVDTSYCSTMLELMNSGKIRNQDSLELLTKLSELTLLYLETGRFDNVLFIYNTIYSLMLKGSFKRETESMIEYFFHSENFINEFSDTIRIWGRLKRDDTLKLARVMKNYVTVPLIDVLCNEESSANRKFLISIISNLGRDAIEEAVKRLNDERWYVVRNMIYLIRESGKEEYIEHIAPFVHHKSIPVKTEALRTLLQFGKPDAIDHIMNFLQSKDLKLKEEAIRLSGIYRIKKAQPLLVDILMKRDLLQARFMCRIAAIRALGRIGDSSVLEVFHTLFLSDSIIYKGAYDTFKKEIINSTVHFKLNDVKSLLELALKSEDDEIQNMAQKMLAGRKHD